MEAENQETENENQEATVAIQNQEDEPLAIRM